MTGERQFRVSWEMPPAISTVTGYEEAFGPGVWRTLSEADWEALPWRPVENVTDDEQGALDQHATLCEWAESHEQPIRNVKLEVRNPNAWQAVE